MEAFYSEIGKTVVFMVCGLIILWVINRICSTYYSDNAIENLKERVSKLECSAKEY